MIWGFVVCFLASLPLYAQPKVSYPALENTTVYRSHKNCHSVDLAHWSHPTKVVLQKAKAILRALDLCDGGKYPIFHVSIENNPLRVVDPFYSAIYAKMWVANGKNPLALDIENWHDIVDLQRSAEGVSETDQSYRS